MISHNLIMIVTLLLLLLLTVIIAFIFNYSLKESILYFCDLLNFVAFFLNCRCCYS